LVVSLAKSDIVNLLTVSRAAAHTTGSPHIAGRHAGAGQHHTPVAGGCRGRPLLRQRGPGGGLPGGAGLAGKALAAIRSHSFISSFMVK